LEDLGIDRRIILKWIFQEMLCAGIDWIGLIVDRDR